MRSDDRLTQVEEKLVALAEKKRQSNPILQSPTESISPPIIPIASMLKAQRIQKPTSTSSMEQAEKTSNAVRPKALSEEEVHIYP